MESLWGSQWDDSCGSDMRRGDAQAVVILSHQRRHLTDCLYFLGILGICQVLMLSVDNLEQQILTLEYHGVLLPFPAFFCNDPLPCVLRLACPNLALG